MSIREQKAKLEEMLMLALKDFESENPDVYVYSVDVMRNEVLGGQTIINRVTTEIHLK